MNSKCEQVQETLSRFLDDDLSATEATRLVAHLETCPVCRHAHDQLLSVQELVRRDRVAPRLPGSDSTRDRVLARVEQAARAPQTQARTVRFWQTWRLPPLAVRPWQPVAATLAAAAVVGGVFLMLPPQDDTIETTPPPAAMRPVPSASGDELSQLLNLHDAHSGYSGTQDAILHRSEAADTHADWLARESTPAEAAL